MTPKTFSRLIEKYNIPYIPTGKRKLFDAVAVEAHLVSLRPVAGVVVKFNPYVRKSVAQKSKFAEAVGI
jgi:hypothetical protein